MGSTRFGSIEILYRNPDRHLDQHPDRHPDRNLNEKKDAKEKRRPETISFHFFIIMAYWINIGSRGRAIITAGLKSQQLLFHLSSALGRFGGAKRSRHWIFLKETQKEDQETDACVCLSRNSHHSSVSFLQGSLKAKRPN